MNSYAGMTFFLETISKSFDKKNQAPPERQHSLCQGNAESRRQSKFQMASIREELKQKAADKAAKKAAAKAAAKEKPPMFTKFMGVFKKSSDKLIISQTTAMYDVTTFQPDLPVNLLPKASA